MTNDHMTLAERDAENSVAMAFHTEMRTTVPNAKCPHLAFL
jgi:hypothetical protein